MARDICSLDPLGHDARNSRKEGVTTGLGEIREEPPRSLQHCPEMGALAAEKEIRADLPYAGVAVGSR